MLQPWVDYTSQGAVLTTRVQNELTGRHAREAAGSQASPLCGACQRGDASGCWRWPLPRLGGGEAVPEGINGEDAGGGPAS